MSNIDDNTFIVFYFGLPSPLGLVGALHTVYQNEKLMHVLCWWCYERKFDSDVKRLFICNNVL